MLTSLAILLKKLYRELYSSPAIISVFSNWWDYFFEIAPLTNSNTDNLYRLRNGMKFVSRSGSSDVRMIKEAFIFNPYSHVNISEDDVVLDIGAHIGTFSVMAGKKVKGKGKVYSYEPSVDTFNVLKDNIDLNSLQETVHPFNLGVSSEDCTRELILFSSTGNELSGSSSFYVEQQKTINANKKKHLQIKCISLKSIIQYNNLKKVNILKMDCEGEEYNILLNTSSEYLMKIDQICVEYHDYLSKEYNHSDLIKRLSNMNFKISHEIPDSLEPECGIIYASRI